MRGLKLGSSLGCTVPTVASFTDAWIETVNDAGHTVTTVSHLLQMRGLKRETDAKVNLSEGRIFYRCVD